MPGPDAPMVDTLTKSQAARRQRVIRASLDLAAEGGYDAVQMRDVAARANVALGTIYRYFSSKDSLLASAMVEWVADLEKTVLARPPAGGSTGDRVMDVLDRALRAMDRQPQLTSAVVTALTSGDPAGVEAMDGMTSALARIMRPAFPDSVDPAEEAAVTKVLGHVWWSCLISWANGMGDMAWVSDELREAADLLTPGFD
ncbi:MAG TPA: TetR family transcriptional regulator [Acidimicrobiales bacterium]|nr:TetR family transcriptional regulator [Acidimicrobiales bacterium]